MQQTYIREINLTNPLGQQGRIAKNYAKLLYHLWVEDKETFAPAQFKRTL